MVKRAFSSNMNFIFEPVPYWAVAAVFRRKYRRFPESAAAPVVLDVGSGVRRMHFDLLVLGTGTAARSPFTPVSSHDGSMFAANLVESNHVMADYRPFE
ncbi:hypothetical protein HJG53_12895 [Sphingomonas sp. ID1715]|uniref:hypothetical protein n=1 Tax=Sphingomonas sp. ID1715 TaxID=1656898 RepID=UPI0014889BEE|nr:hypothetical protein [Sphingomonas sp. ID1715]NNM77805.1 hypothetical protein [Sphingomonas sp. ID1715]